MAGIITPQFGFHPAAVDHSPSPLSFAFGLSSAASVPGWQPPGMHHSTFSPSPAAFSSSQKSSHKRRHDEADIDELMDRSPTPERRPVRPIKQLRVKAEELSQPGDHSKAGKDGRSSQSNTGDDVDVGMLLASLPPQSLLPILTTLLSTHPSLKPTVLSLIPRPTLETALNAVNQAAKKLVDEYPYSASSTPFPHQTTSISFGFGSGAFGSSRPSSGSNLSPSSTSNFSRASPNTSRASGMRDDYILSRLRPLISNFVSTAFSYMRYFSFVPEASDSQSPAPGKERIYPHASETFAYLSALTNHLLNQPALCQSSLAPLLLPRLLQEWMAWVNRVDELLRQGGMIGSGVAESWIAALDRYSEAKIEGVDEDIKYGLRSVRDRWITVAGWLVGRGTAR